jgi:DNA ligase-1
MKPMLAFKYADKKRHLSYPCHIQPKLNGVRMLYQNGSLQSRSHGQDTELLWASHRLARIRSALAHVHPGIVLDGELYRHGWSLQKINAAAAINRLEDTPDTDLLEYHVFDCYIPLYPHTPFAERLDYLRDIYLTGSNYCSVPTINVLAEEQAEPYYAKWRADGYEGMMYRQSNSPYGLAEACSNKENRWTFLLKRKDWLDDEFECVGFEMGLGKYSDAVGALVFRLPSGRTFSAGSGLSDAERYAYINNPPVEQLFRIRYEMLSDEGIPLKPTIECAL